MFRASSNINYFIFTIHFSPFNYYFLREILGYRQIINSFCTKILLLYSWIVIFQQAFDRLGKNAIEHQNVGSTTHG